MNQYRTTSRLLAGMQTGMAGALVLLAWMAVSMLWSRHSVWWYPNLLATTFGGDPALRTTFGKFTLAGLALHFIQFSALGAAVAAFVPPRLPFSRMILLGLLISLGFYYLMYGWIWKQVNPLIPLYSPDRQILIGHILYGFMLARLPRYWSASVPTTEYNGRS